MPKDEALLPRGDTRPLRTGTIVAGAALHFVLPAYLLACLAFCAFELVNGSTPPEVAARLLPFSGWFAVVYLAAAGSTTAIAGLLDPTLRRRRDRRNRRDPARAEMLSRHRTAQAIAEARAKLPPRARAAIETIASAGWLHGNEIYQNLSFDLAEVVRTSAAALTTASPERREELESVASSALNRIAAELGELKKQQTRLDEGDLRTLAGYVEQRYRSSDFAGDSNS